jgi:hypothetical protein
MSLPQRATHLGLLFSGRFKRLIAHLRLKDSPYGCARLYSREPQTEYSELGNPDSHESYESPVIMPTTGELYFNRIAWSESGGVWGGIYRANFNGEIVCVFDDLRGKFDLAAERQCHVAAIVPMETHGRVLCCVVAARPLEIGRVEYFLASLDLDGGSMMRLAQLDTPFA